MYRPGIREEKRTRMGPEIKIGDILIDGEIVTLFATAYATGSLAVIAQTEDGMPYATLSTNLDPPLSAESGLFAMKDWSENATISAIAAKSGFFQPQGYDDMRTGAAIWSIREEA